MIRGSLCGSSVGLPIFFLLCPFSYFALPFSRNMKEETTGNVMEVNLCRFWCQWQ
jgi:hypothetical protein